jgi:hypothetical protein
MTPDNFACYREARFRRFPSFRGQFHLAPGPQTTDDLIETACRKTIRRAKQNACAGFLDR